MRVPTTKPRYQLTDSGTLQRALDRAATRWPEARGDRRELLRRMIEFADERLADERPGDPAASPDLDAYAGQWVAIRGSHVLNAAATSGEVAGWLRANGQRAEQLFRVVGLDGEVPSEHGLG